MKHSLLLVALLGGTLVGCASHQTSLTPVPAPVVQTYAAPPAPTYVAPAPIEAPKIYKLKNYDGPEAMTNNEVLEAQRECLLRKMRPHVTKLSVKTEYSSVLVPVSVECEPF
jgi:energy-converting hydrogenase Eha subunit F